MDFLLLGFPFEISETLYQISTQNIRKSNINIFLFHKLSLQKIPLDVGTRVTEREANGDDDDNDYINMKSLSH